LRKAETVWPADIKATTRGDVGEMGDKGA